MDNQQLNELREILIDRHLLQKDYTVCIDWAITQLEKGDDNIEMCYLASLTSDDKYDIENSLRCLYPNYNIFDVEVLEERVGKIIIDLADDYYNKKIDTYYFDRMLDKLSKAVDYPNWLIILSRNCEYATDIDYFEDLFMDELSYITGLWKEYPRYNEFHNNYQREKSNQNMMK